MFVLELSTVTLLNSLEHSTEWRNAINRSSKWCNYGVILYK